MSSYWVLLSRKKHFPFSAAVSVVLCLLWVTPAVAQNSQSNDWTIVPDLRVGPVTATFSERDLRSSFGDASVTNGSMPGAEGEPTAATFVYQDDPTRALAIAWKDADKKANPDTIFVCQGLSQGTCKWHTPSGITIGTTLTELEKQNGSPLLFYGFGWYYSGIVISWQGGKLMHDLGNTGVVGVAVAPANENWADKLTPLQRKKLSGEKKISSDDLTVQKLNIVVHKLTFGFQ